MVSSATSLRVKELLREKRWTTKMLAEKTGMSESYLTHIKNGTRRWNEDILKRLSEAFEVHPVDLFIARKRSGIERKERSARRDESTQAEAVPLMLPVMKEIPAHPSPYANQMTQLTTGCKDHFVPVIGCNDPDAFCIKLDASNLKPEFSRGDYLIVSPAASAATGDLVAIEFMSAGRQVRQFMHISFAGSFVILEMPNHKHLPVALAKNRDAYRIIGKVIYHYQKVD